jgi:hypothetical protein
MIMNEVTYLYEGGAWITLPAPHAFSYSLRPKAPVPRTADGQPSNTCAYNLPNCWAPYCPDPFSDDEQSPSAEDSHTATADMGADMVDQLAKTTLGSEPETPENGSAILAEVLYDGGDSDMHECQRAATMLFES